MASIHEQFRVAQRWFREHYTQMFYGLLPNGFIWKPRQWDATEVIQDIYQGETDWQDTHDSSDEIQDVIRGAGDGDLLMRIFLALSGELERVEAAAWNLFNQSDPGLATSLLEDWEADLGLPEDCYEGVELTVEQRQIFAHEKHFKTGETTTRQWFIDYAENLGYVIDITELPEFGDPAICDISRCDDCTCDGRGGYSDMIVHILEADHDVSIIECMLDKAKQAHVTIFYLDYTSSGLGDYSEIEVSGTGTKEITFRGTGSIYLSPDLGEAIEEIELEGETTDVVWSHNYTESGSHYIRFYESDSL